MRSSSTGTNAAANRQSRNVRHSANRSMIRGAAQQFVESLEGRQLLSSTAFTPTTADLNSIKNGPFAKGGSALISIFNAYTKFVKSGASRYDFSASSPLADDYVLKSQDVALTIQTNASVASLTTLIKNLGGSIIYRSKGRHVVEAYLPISQTDNLATNKNILHMRPMGRSEVSSVGNGTNLAERALKSEDVLPAYNVDGTGQTVGVISDSFDGPYIEERDDNNGDAASDVANGDLPDVNVLTDQAGTNEGRAMAQLVHDVAPGAGLAFATVGVSQLTFANAITSLREDAKSTVIVDDVSFGSEPFFQPGVIDRAIDDVTADGANYLSAAGNQGFAGYQRKADFVTDSAVKGGSIVDFDPGKGVATSLNINIKKAGTLYMQWDDAYDGVVAQVRSDVDFYLYRNGTLIQSSTDNNFATGVPLEQITVDTPGKYQIMIKVNSVGKGGALPTLYKFAADGNNPDMFDARTDVDFTDSQSASAVSGHAHATLNIPVGAVDYVDTNALGASRGVSNETYSSGGTVLEVFDQNGNRYDTPKVLTGTLVSSVDGTATTVKGTVITGEVTDFTRFPGTSAAAPNAAAVVALLRQISPDADPATIRDALVASAKSNPLNGSKAGTLDPQGGYGLIDAVKAAAILNPDIPTATIQAPSGGSGGSVNSITVKFSEPVTGVDLSDFILTRDGTSRNRFTGSETLSASADGTTYTIGGIKSATSVLGFYTLQLRNARTDILDEDGNVAAGDVLSFDVSLRKPTNLVADTLDDGKIRLRWTDSNRGEDNYRIQRATDPDFSVGIRNIDLPAGVTTYTDSDVEAGQIYYYRVRAVKGGKLGDVGRISTVASSAGQVFVDDKSAKLSGNWITSADDTAFLQSKSRVGATDLLTETANTATFTSKDIATGFYFLYTRFTVGSKNASNASYQILQGKKLLATVKVDQTTRAGGWVLLGKFASLTAGGLSVRLTSAGANGTVVADAVQFLPADEATIAAYEAQKSKDA